MIVRICRVKGCRTQLSIYNDRETCWVHTVDLTQVPPPLKHYRHRTRKPRAHVVSSRFIAGISGSYDFSPQEREEYERWANAVAEDVEQEEGVNA